MVAKLTLDKAGRIVLPKPVRDELNLTAGDTLELETSGGDITLHPVRATTPLQKERGVWVIRTGDDLPASVVEDTIRQIRQERERIALGEEP
jgi:AbrB family looped-hinge helix DNA binding protein